jgi:hypothetical protein
MGETCPVCGGQACGESRAEPPEFRVGGLYLTRNRKHAVLVENSAGRSLVGAFIEHGYLLPPARVTACDGTVVLHSINNRYTWSKGGRFGEETELGPCRGARTGGDNPGR